MLDTVLNTWRSLLGWKWPTEPTFDHDPIRASNRPSDYDLIRNRLELISVSRHQVRHRLVQNWIRDFGDIPEEF